MNTADVRGAWFKLSCFFCVLIWLGVGCDSSAVPDIDSLGFGGKGQPCFANAACNLDLTCEQGLCQECSPGKIGCECGAANSCNAGAECNSGRCVPEGACVPGTQDCVCVASQCNPGLTCTPQGMCQTCTSDVAGCPCEDADFCGAGLECTAGGTCERPAGAPPVILDTCYSPCRDDIRLSDGTLVRCSAEGLFQGCLPGTDCVAGSCVADTRPRYCDDEMECPDFQTCVDGECRSTCESRNDCSQGLACYKHVCRAPCSGDDTCTDDEYCNVVDASTGYCMPLRRKPDLMAGGQPRGEASDDIKGVGQPEHLEVTLGADFVSLNSAKSKGTVRLINTGDHQVEFTVQKIDHTEIRDGRTVTVSRGDQTPPLHWLKLGFEKGAQSNPAADKVDNLMGSLDFGGKGNLVMEVAAEAPRQWQGTIEVSSVGRDDRLATQSIRIAYTARPEGRFAGDAIYFASFDTRGLDTWVNSDKTVADDDKVNNAFIRRWRDFVRYQTGVSAGRLTYPDLQSFLTATRDETWRNQSVKEICPRDQDGNERNDPICYLAGNSQGYSLYTENQLRYPVPFGGVSFPMAVNIRAGGQLGTQGGIQYTGRIDTAASMHYGGDPTINLSFEGEPTQCPNATDGRSCVVPIKTFNADIVVPGRYRDFNNGCRDIGEATFTTAVTPWLVPGFPNGAMFNSDQQQWENIDCLGNDAPFALDALANTQIARANPIPDGLPRVRRIELIDGALIDGERFIIIFREEMGSLLVPGEKVYNYGYLDLRRQGDTLDGEDYESNDQAWTEIPGGQSPLQTYTCSEAIRQQAFAVGDDAVEADFWNTIESWDARLAENVASVMLTGRESVVTATPYDPQRIQWLCRGTNVSLQEFNEQNQLDMTTQTGARVVGYFNQGGPDPNEPCDESSTLHYFALPPGFSRAQLADHSCNQDGSCHIVYDGWRAGSRTVETLLDGTRLTISDVVFDPISNCEQNGSVTAVECTSNRQDPTQGKVFYQPGEGGLHFDPLRTEVRAAFRYRTEFLGRDGTPIGFPPEICSEDLNQTPFCYDPELIEQVRDRVDCLMSVYHVHRDKLWNGSSSQQALAVDVRDYLTENFSSRIDFHPFGNPNLPTCEGGSSASCLPVESMGFERLYAELLILLGDEAYTQSFASRFDLAGIRNRAFNGPAFEGPQGIELSGGVGYEMFLLYQATQYHEMVIDRFARIARALGETTLDQRGKRTRVSTDPCVGNCPALVDAPERVDWTFMTQGTVTTYMSRLLKASTQKSRAANQISKKYQSFNRPELARQVINRFYPAAYLEFLLFSRLLDSIIQVSTPQASAQLEAIQQQAALTYRMALLDMRKAYGEISDDITFFGFAPDYIPIPVLADGQANSFERMYDIAFNQSLIAADKEQIALASDRASRTGLAEFRSELSDIRTEYETQLGELCGYVEGSDGKLYPAIARYAHLFRDAEGLQGSDNASLAIAFQQPCGRFGSGELFEATVEQVEAQLDYQQARKVYETHLNTVEAIRVRTRKVCNEDFDFSKDARWNISDSVSTDLQDRIGDFEGDLAIMDMTNAIVSATSGAASGCSDSLAGAAGGDPLGKVPATALATISCVSQGVGAASEIANATLTFKFNSFIDRLQGQVDDLERVKSIREKVYEQCASAQADEGPAISQVIGDVLAQQIEILKKSQQISLRLAAVTRLRNQLRILEAEYDEKSQLAIDAAAAANDPNVRIYRNDEIIAADRTFNRAIKSAYKATKVFEYYTGQSYEERDKLLLSRTVVYGDYSLEAYLEDLEDAYIAYQELYGSPDRRVLIKSLREDILFADLYDDNGEPMSQEARDEAFKALLSDEKWLDKNSYISIPFAINVEETSPLTHNHKLDYVRAEIVYDGRTDVLARIYLRPAGTSTIRTDGLDPFFYRMPPQISVINPSFNGAFLEQAKGDVSGDDLDDEIFIARRLRDRPLVNTQWELVLNLVDEQVNKDLLLDEIKDVRLFFYYNDFTAIPR